MFLLGCCVVLWLVSISLGFYPPVLDCILGFLENFDSENHMLCLVNQVIGLGLPGPEGASVGLLTARLVCRRCT